MGKRISIKQKRKEAPEWVFDWRRRDSGLSKWIALLLVGGAFALLLPALRIRVVSPVTWAAPKATVFHTAGGAEGRILARRAREGGPFPSRFLPAEWDGYAALEQEFQEASRRTPQAYVPVLRDLPGEEAPPMQLALRGVPVLPKRQPSLAAVPVATKLTLVPVIHPLAGIRAGEITRVPSPADGMVNATMTKKTWRFLLRLDAAGHVRDCVSLAGGNEPGLPLMEDWLRRVTFKPDSRMLSRWVAVGVGFANQVTTDGTDAR